MRKEKKIGDKVTVVIKRFNKNLVIDGKVKDTRSSYGKKEYLITGGRILKDFFARNIK